MPLQNLNKKYGKLTNTKQKVCETQLKKEEPLLVYVNGYHNRNNKLLKSHWNYQRFILKTRSIYTKIKRNYQR